MGKTSLVHLIMKGSSIARPSQTVGCSVSVKVRLLFAILESVGKLSFLDEIHVFFFFCSIQLMGILLAHRVA